MAYIFLDNGRCVVDPAEVRHAWRDGSYVHIFLHDRKSSSMMRADAGPVRTVPCSDAEWAALVAAVLGAKVEAGHAGSR
jgi:hypothetical protein